MRTNLRTFPGAEVVPESSLAPLDLASVFARVAPLEVDLGCGDGSFLVALARENPARNFLGVERLPGRIRGASRKVGHHELANARILHADIQHSVQHLLPAASVDVFHLMFPDPWPKRRHQPRRTFNAGFLRAVARALKPAGALRVSTDDAVYFAAMQGVIAESGELATDHAPEIAPLPQSTFESRFHGVGAEIHRCVVRKISVGAR